MAPNFALAELRCGRQLLAVRRQSFRNFFTSLLFDFENMKSQMLFIALAMVMLEFVGCSKNSQTTTARQLDSVTNATAASRSIDTNHFQVRLTVPITNSSK
jgi:hypothetical protein